jgi:hypothetical protein
MKVKLSTIENIVKTARKTAKHVASAPATKTSQTKLSSCDVINSSRFQSYAIASSKKVSGGLCTSNVPSSYADSEIIEVAEYSFQCRMGKDKGKTKIVPAHKEKYSTWRPRYHLDKLWTTGKGSGTRSVQALVRRSLQDVETQGRVTLDACCIDGETAPGGFYYKLGFRFTNPEMNRICKEWIEQGGKRENAPWATGMMYLPKENISKCLNYGIK